MNTAHGKGGLCSLVQEYQKIKLDKRSRDVSSDDDDDAMVVVGDSTTEPPAKRARPLVGDELREALFPPGTNLPPEIWHMILSDPMFDLNELVRLTGVNAMFRDMIMGGRFLERFFTTRIIGPLKERIDKRMVQFDGRAMDYATALDKFYGHYSFYVHYLKGMTNGNAFNVFRRALATEMTGVFIDGMHNGQNDGDFYLAVEPIGLRVTWAGDDESMDEEPSYDDEGEYKHKPVDPNKFPFEQAFEPTLNTVVNQAVRAIMAYRTTAKNQTLAVRQLEQAFFTLVALYPTTLSVTLHTFEETRRAGYWYSVRDRDIPFLPEDAVLGDAHSPEDIIEFLLEGPHDVDRDEDTFMKNPEVIHRYDMVLLYVPTAQEWFSRHHALQNVDHDDVDLDM